MLTLSLRRPIALGSNSLSLHLISCVTAGSPLIYICVAYSVWVFFFLSIYLFIWLHWVLVVTHGIQFPEQGWNPRPPALGAQSLNQSTTREVPGVFLRTELDTHF